MTHQAAASTRLGEVTAATVRTIREDAARWVRPEQVAPVEEVTLSKFLRLCLTYLPLRATTWFRIGHAAHQLGVRGVPSAIQRHLLVRFGLEIPPSSDVGGGLYVAHPVGCVLVTERAGRNLTVIGAVTFGTRRGDRWPTLGDDVFVGIGARVLGGVSIGDGASIGANAVVLDDVEPGCTAVGAPARVVRRPAID